MGSGGRRRRGRVLSAASGQCGGHGWAGAAYCSGAEMVFGNGKKRRVTSEVFLRGIAITSITSVVGWPLGWRRGTTPTSTQRATHWGGSAPPGRGGCWVAVGPSPTLEFCRTEAPPSRLGTGAGASQAHDMPPGCRDGVAGGEGGEGAGAHLASAASRGFFSDNLPMSTASLSCADKSQRSCLPACVVCTGPPRCQTALPVRSRGDPWHRAPRVPVLFPVLPSSDF